MVKLAELIGTLLGTVLKYIFKGALIIGLVFVIQFIISIFFSGNNTGGKRNSKGFTPIRDEMKRIDKMSGRQFEYWCAELLKRYGYQNVVVTKGSGDKGVDIVCNNGSIKVAIQCKCYNKPLGNKPIQEVYTGKTYYDCKTAIVMTNNYFTEGAKELAKKTDVMLYDRNKIFEMLNSIASRGL